MKKINLLTFSRSIRARTEVSDGVLSNIFESYSSISSRVWGGNCCSSGTFSEFDTPVTGSDLKFKAFLKTENGLVNESFEYENKLEKKKYTLSQKSGLRNFAEIKKSNSSEFIQIFESNFMGENCDFVITCSELVQHHFGWSVRSRFWARSECWPCVGPVLWANRGNSSNWWSQVFRTRLQELKN